MITINRSDVRVELSVSEALALIESLAKGVLQATRFKVGSGGVLPLPVVVNGEQKAAPGILSFNITTE